MIKVLAKCYQSTSTLIVLGITKYNPQTITIIVHYQACTLATITYGRKGLTLIRPWVTKPWAAQISQVRALGAHYNFCSQHSLDYSPHHLPPYTIGS